MFYGNFLVEWNVSTVTLLPKSGDKTHPGNWRPISNTCIFSKILEKLVHKQLSHYIMVNNLISPHQYGFEPGRSTHEAVFNVVKLIYSCINNKKYIGIVFLDIAKAFNCMNHDIFDIVLSNLGISQRVRSWIKSYNTIRQCVKIGDNTSNVLPVEFGTAQGTVLGPLVFIFYFNNIISQIDKCNVSMFADDCVIYQSGNSWDIVHSKLQSDLGNIVRWTEQNFLTLNRKKTQALIIGTRCKLQKVQDPKYLNINGEYINYVKQYTYLGIILDSEMTLQPLLKHVKKLLTNKIFALRKIRNYITDKSAVVIYKQTILPVIDYSGFLLLSCSHGDHSDLQKIQNDILRICFKSKLAEKVKISELHRKAHMLSLEQRMRKHPLWPMYIHSLNRNNRKLCPRLLRNNNKYFFKIDSKIGTKYRNSPYCNGTLLWNDLPVNMQFADTVGVFKQKLRLSYRVYVNLL